MFVFENCGYNDLLKTVAEMYRNKSYRAWFNWRLDENGAPYRKNEPNDLKNVSITLMPNDMLNGVRISYIIKKIGEKENTSSERLFIPDEKSMSFLEAHNLEGVWKEAAEALIDFDELIRKKFPGYYITNKRTY